MTLEDDYSVYSLRNAHGFGVVTSSARKDAADQKPLATTALSL